MWWVITSTASNMSQNANHKQYVNEKIQIMKCNMKYGSFFPFHTVAQGLQIVRAGNLQFHTDIYYWKCESQCEWEIANEDTQ